MQGFFEQIVKVGFGVVFGLMLFELLPLLFEFFIDGAKSMYDGMGWYVWLTAPFAILLISLPFVLMPLLTLIPFFLILNKIKTGKFGTEVEYSEKARRELVWFYIFYVLFFWGLLVVLNDPAHN